MADEMKKLNLNASNGSFSFPVVDQTARNAAQAAQTAAEEAKNEAESAKSTAQSASQAAGSAQQAAQAAQTAVGNITIPATLPNPNKLIFTGGATGEYDGTKAVTITIPTGGEGSGGSGPVQYVESLDESNLANLRDLATGPYVLYGYFYPYDGAADTLTCDNTLVSVAHLSAGSHVLVFNPLNCKVNFVEILVDETAASGFTYSVQLIDMRDLNALKNLVSAEGINLTDRTTGTAYTLYIDNGKLTMAESEG